jgi:hypothetical protein
LLVVLIRQHLQGLIHISVPSSKMPSLQDCPAIRLNVVAFMSCLTFLRLLNKMEGILEQVHKNILGCANDCDDKL